MFKALTAGLAVAALAGAAYAQVDHSNHGGAKPAAAAGTPAAATAAAPTKFSADTPIEKILANPAAKAVLDKHIPMIATHEALPMFQAMSLKDVAPMSNGAITPELITAVDADLAKVPAA